MTSLTFETEVPVDRDWSTLFGVYHYDARGATEECADLLGQQSGSRQYRKSGFAPPRNWASTSIRLLPLSRCSTAERLCPLLPARTERRDYSGREPAKSKALGNADSRCSRSTRLARATEESTLALKTGPLLFPGVAHRPHDGWRLWPRGCPLGRIEHRTVHRTAAEERAKPRLPSFLPVEGTPWIRIRRL